MLFSAQVDNFTADLVAIYHQLAHRNWQIETPWAGAAWVEVEHAVPGLLPGNVAVAVDDGLNAGGFGIQVELFQDVQNVNCDAFDFDELGLGKVLGIHSVIDVPAHGGYGSNLSQTVEDRWIADITGMDDVI